MPKATVTFTDGDNDGGVTVSIEFDPEVSDDSYSTAQVMAFRAMRFAVVAASKSTREDE